MRSSEDTVVSSAVSFSLGKVKAIAGLSLFWSSAFGQRPQLHLRTWPIGEKLCQPIPQRFPGDAHAEQPFLAHRQEKAAGFSYVLGLGTDSTRDQKHLSLGALEGKRSARKRCLCR